MNKLILIAGLLFLSVGSYSQSSDRNYVKTTVYRTADGLNKESIHYVDGLGRPILDILKNQSGNGAGDIVTKKEYDACGRDWKEWIPTAVPNNNGNYLTNLINDLDQKPYSEIEYEPSPLNRVNTQWGAGAEWSNHPIRTEYLFNEGSKNLMCKLYSVNLDGILTCDGDYKSWALAVIKTIDEDENVTYSFKDKLGRVVLSRQVDGYEYFDTYYVYDDVGNLRYVLPPLASDKLQDKGVYTISDKNALGLYAYYYRYDERNQCVEKKLPGISPIYMVYDKSGRLILTQTGKQRSKSLWTINKYDVLGRLLYTAEIKNIYGVDYLVDLIGGWVATETYSSDTNINGKGNIGYSCNLYQEVITRLLTVNYYDDYSFLDLNSSIKPQLTYSPNTSYGNKYSDTMGRLTGTRVYNLNSPSKYLVTALYYDKDGNIIQERSSNCLDGYDITYNSYDLLSNVLGTYKEHYVSMYDNISITEKYRYTYDHANRLANTYYQYGNEQEIALSENVYDEVGRLKIKYRHNRQDTIITDYNIRDWITQIKNGTFEENLFYNSNPQDVDAYYNGNISVMQWKYNKEYNSYQFYYDPLNRLTMSLSYIGKDMSDSSNDYQTVYRYDKNGNITYLFRNTLTYGNLDDLTTTYWGNQLMSVTDECGSQDKYDLKEYRDLSTERNFYYDNNGNMIADLDRNIVTIRYNSLNLPDTIQFKNGSQIINTYMADGRKIRTDYITYRGIYDLSISLGGIYDWDFYYDIIVWYADIYADDCVYRYNKETDGTYLDLSKVYNTEGYKALDYGGLYNYYYRKDHLGSIRETWCAQSNAVTQRMQYYPFGMPWEECENNLRQRNKFNGKEYIEDHGYDVYDYGARQYMSTIGRFTSIDPHCEKYYSISPYAYCMNNPIRFIDPDGRDIWQIDKDGLLVWGDESREYQLWGVDVNSLDKVEYDDKTVPQPKPKPNKKDAYAPAVAIPASALAGEAIAGGAVALEAVASFLGVVSIIFTLQGDSSPDHTQETIVNENNNQQHTNDANSKKKSSTDSKYNQEAEHTSNARQSSENMHEKGQKRKQVDKGGEKGDKRRTRYK